MSASDRKSILSSFGDPMKIIKVKIAMGALFFLFFSLFWSAGSVVAQDFIVGTVLTADIDKMEIELLPMLDDQVEGNQKRKRSMTVQLSAENLVVNRRGERVFPGCVFPGGIVRIWGRMDGGSFIVSDIRGSGGGHGRGDPTGVRRRLQRMGPGYPSGGWHGGWR
jgi:hypothetical protein